MLLERTLTEICRAVDVLPGLTVYDYVPDSVEVPAFYTADVSVQFSADFGQAADYEVICRVLTGRGEDRSGQRALLAYMGTGPGSIWAAIMAARGGPGEYALNGAADDVMVRRVQGHRIYTVGEKSYYGAEVLVRAIGNGDGNDD